MLRASQNHWITQSPAVVHSLAASGMVTSKLVWFSGIETELEAYTSQEMRMSPRMELVLVLTTETLAVPVWGARMSTVKGTTSPTLKDWTLSVLSSYLKPLQSQTLHAAAS